MMESQILTSPQHKGRDADNEDDEDFDIFADHDAGTSSPRRVDLQPPLLAKAPNNPLMDMSQTV